MKAVIVEIKGRSAAVLSDDGCIEHVKNSNYKIGQVIEMHETSIRRPSRLKVLATAAAAFIVLCSTSALAYFTPYSYVSVDVNPSVALSLNIFDRVLSVTAVNADGEEVLQNIEVGSLNNQKIDDAISVLVEEITAEGYFSEDGAIVVATASNDEAKAEELAEQLQESVQQATQEQTGEEVEVEVISVGYARVQEARELGVTPGKLNLVEKLQASAADPESINIEEWLHKSVKEIQKATKENKKAAKAGLPGEEAPAEETPGEVTIDEPTGEAAINGPEETASPEAAVNKNNGSQGNKEKEKNTNEEKNQNKPSGQASKGNSGNSGNNGNSKKDK